MTLTRLGRARLWDTRTGEALTPPIDQDALIKHAELSPAASRIFTWDEQGDARLWDISIDTRWPPDRIVLRTEVETGTYLNLTGEISALSAADWTRKRFCKYDAIRHDLKRLSQAEWSDAQRRCQALAAPEQPPTH